jgi:hypothetical protein
LSHRVKSGLFCYCAWPAKSIHSEPDRREWHSRGYGFDPRRLHWLVLLGQTWFVWLVPGQTDRGKGVKPLASVLLRSEQIFHIAAVRFALYWVWVKPSLRPPL